MFVRRDYVERLERHNGVLRDICKVNAAKIDKLNACVAVLEADRSDILALADRYHAEREAAREDIVLLKGHHDRLAIEHNWRTRAADGLRDEVERLKGLILRQNHVFLSIREVLDGNDG